MKFPHNISRIEAFSDAVFAFAATLLVVAVGSDSEGSVLQINWLHFLSFAVSFFALAGIWSVHYNFFRRTHYMDNWIVAINTILLFLVLYYIFPIKSLINSWAGTLTMDMESFSSLFQLYSLGFLLIFSCYSLMYWRAYRKTKVDSSDFDLLFYARHFGIYVIVAAISIALAKLQWGLTFGLPGIIYGLLGPFCYFHGVQF
ncbi:MAG: TMEM175 family protein, partial [Bacteroidota bacterium]